MARGYAAFIAASGTPSHTQAHRITEPPPPDQCTSSRKAISAISARKYTLNVTDALAISVCSGGTSRAEGRGESERWGQHQHRNK